MTAIIATKAAIKMIVEMVRLSFKAPIRESAVGYEIVEGTKEGEQHTQQ